MIKAGIAGGSGFTAGGGDTIIGKIMYMHH
jgi:hypothetical protein